MGLFDFDTEADKQAYQKLNKLIRDLNVSYARDYSETKNKRYIQYLETIRKSPESTPIKPFSLFVEVAYTIATNRVDYHMMNHLDGMQKAETLYPQLFPFADKTPAFEDLCVIFVSFFQSNGLGSRGLFHPTLFSTFQHKVNYVDFMGTVMEHKNISSCLEPIAEFGLSVRAFFTEDESYTANLKQVANRLLNSANRAQILQEEQKKVEHMAGIYDIDEADVAKTEQQLVKANAILNGTVGILEEADRKTAQLNRIMKDTTESIQELSKRETALISSKAASAKDDITAAYNSFLEEQRQEIVLQKDILVSQIYQEAEAKLGELKAMAKAITLSANTDLQRINKETAVAMEKIQDLVTNDKEIQKILDKADANQDIYEKISKLEILSNQNIETLTKGFEAQLAAQSNPQVVVAQSGTPKAATVVVQEGAASPMVQATTVVDPAAAPEVIAATEVTTQVMSGVNMFFDNSIPFTERYQLVMEEKQRRMKNGEHFHEKFDDVLTILMEDANPYMIGPSGCGKTYMVKQIASLLGMDFTDIGYINEEYDILGFQTATGAYSATNFYRCYKYGKIAFCDELDNGNSRATVKLNSFLSNGKDACYSFPNGESVKRHSNFRIIAAGNTAGNGADANYNTREKIEESVQQRFTPIYVGYDNAVEEKILGQYKNWYQFCVLFRIATDAWGNLNDCSAPGILTTRDTARIRRYLDNRSLGMEKILDYEFIQTKDMEYLAFLTKHMGERILSFPEAKNIYECFKKKVEELRKNGGAR